MVSCPTELGRGVIPSMVGLQLTQLSGNCSIHQHVVNHNSISCQKKTTFVGTHDWTFQLRGVEAWLVISFILTILPVTNYMQTEVKSYM